MVNTDNFTSGLAYIGEPEPKDTNHMGDLTTRILENNLSQLDSLRASIERAGMKDIFDVRDYGDSMAASLFVGCEGTITYHCLLDVIEHFKNGIASRRVAALT